MNKTDKVWLITGSSTGFGRALARAVLERGYLLVALIQVVESDNPPLRLALGEDSVNLITQKLASMKADLEAWKDVSVSTGLEEAKASAKG